MSKQYDKALEARVKAWIEGMVGYELQGADFREQIVNGVAICELINKIQPKKIAKIHKSKIVMFQRENFGSFIKASLDFGVLPNETATFEDVFNNQNMGQFLINIISLARKVQFQPGFTGPMLEDARPIAQATHQEFTAEQLLRTAAAPTAAQAALDKIGKTMEEGRFVEHGVIANPDEHIFHGTKE